MDPSGSEPFIVKAFHPGLITELRLMRNSPRQKWRGFFYGVAV